MRNGLTATFVFEATSANYGEGFSNITQMKMMTRGDYKEYPYISRQALRYNMIEQLQWNNTPIDDKGVVQFAPDASIKDYPEIDLFGYMKTAKKTDENGNTLKRSAVVRLSHAIGLEPYKGDMDYLTNMGLSSRGKGLNNSIAVSEIQRSFYTYTISIDLDLIGVDVNDNTNLSSEEKTKRVCDFLNTVEFLYRDIKGRRENLAPVFAIGGIYERKNPFFMNSISLDAKKLKLDGIMDLLKIDEIKTYTKAGLVHGAFENESEIESELSCVSIHEFFQDLQKDVKEYYEGNQN